MRILIIGTHPNQTNGYARVMNQMITELSKEHKVICYGFNANMNYLETKYNKNVIMTAYDDFGIDQISNFVDLCNPDKIIIYNDPITVCMFLQEINKIEKTFQTIVYLDLVYKYIKSKHIETLNIHADIVITFLEHWKHEVKRCGYNGKIEVLPHTCHSSVFKVEKLEARRQLGMPEDGLILLNLNKNTPRKRYDLFLTGLSHFFMKNPESKLIVAIGTMREGAFDLDEFIKIFPNLQGRIDFVANPHNMTDTTINLMYNACDIGANVSDGEGFGLCNFEHACVGAPQIVTETMSSKEIYREGALFVPIKCNYFNDSTRDGIGGMAELIDIDAFVEKLEDIVENFEQYKGKFENIYTNEHFSETLLKIVNQS
mgnify:CR=1 FL=1